jgi:hypothetical protein
MEGLFILKINTLAMEPKNFYMVDKVTLLGKGAFIT